MSDLVGWFRETPLAQIGIADVVDILVVSVLVSTVLAFMRRTRARFVAIGLGLLGVLYVVARAFGMELTTGILGAFFAVFLVIVVVIFQEELRQLFERLATWGLRASRTAGVGARQEHVDVLVRCLTDFAQQRIGALVVLPGRQPVGRHVRGGIPCDGRLSMPLLKSIFDPHSPGHDGAVIIETGRVSLFAVHLPLSRSFEQLAGRGTRHSATLGLSELTDALCLVVSEERGEISVAEGGRLERVTDPQVLTKRIARAMLPPTPDEHPRGWRRGQRVVRDLARSWRERLAVVGLVTALWVVVVPGGRPEERSYSVHVGIRNVPAGFEVESVEPPVVEVTLRGVRRGFYFFDARRLGVQIDGALIPLGRRTYNVGREQVYAYPAELRVQAIEPDAVRISVREVPAD